MMPVSADHQLQNQDLSDLERRRLILNRIVDIARAIESMRESLQAVLLMGLASNDLSKQAPRGYDAFSDTMHTLSSGEVSEHHTNLELIVNMQLNRILSYSSIDFSSAEGGEFIKRSHKSDPQSPLKLLNAFKRTAQTAVSLRMLLHKRGVPTPGSVLSASNEELKRHLTHLARQLADQRGRITRQIKLVEAEIVRVIDNRYIAGAIKRMLHEEATNLNQDRRLLAEGGSIACLSFIAASDESVTAGTEAREFDGIAIETRAPACDKSAK